MVIRDLRGNEWSARGRASFTAPPRRIVDSFAPHGAGKRPYPAIRSDGHRRPAAPSSSQSINGPGMTRSIGRSAPDVSQGGCGVGGV